MDSREAKVTAFVQCAAAIAAIAIFVLLSGPWYFRVLPAVLVVIIVNATLRGRHRRLHPPAEQADRPVISSWEFATVNLVVVAIGICVAVFLPGPRTLSGLLGSTFFIACGPPLIRAWARLRNRI
jgi:hypothetical protein